MNTKMVALVGMGKKEIGSKYPSNTVFIWQDITQDNAFLSREFSDEILSVKIRQDL